MSTGTKTGKKYVLVVPDLPESDGKPHHVFCPLCVNVGPNEPGKQTLEENVSTPQRWPDIN